MDNIIGKITKLLSLAGSSNENEARAAMLKARALMAEHKLRPEDITPQANARIVRRTIGITCTKMTDVWAVQLNQLIARHYCCVGYRHRNKGAKKVELGLIGLAEDFAVCERISKYAYESVKSRCGELTDYGKHVGMDAKDIREACNTYGWGFCSGLSEAFDLQAQEHQEWGLVMAVPQPVMDVVNSMEKAQFVQPNVKDRHGLFLKMGYADGRRFKPERRIPESDSHKALA